MRREELQELLVPAELSPGAVTVLEWRVHEGERFTSEQPLVDLVTPAGVRTVHLTENGRLHELLVDEGWAVEPGQPIAYFSSEA